MFIIYRQEVDKAPEYVAVAYNREDATLKMVTMARRRVSGGSASASLSPSLSAKEEKYFIVDRTAETPSGTTVDEFKQVTEMVDEGWLLSDMKPKVKTVLIAKYFILEVPSGELRTKGTKYKLTTLYDADEIIELLRSQRPVDLVMGDRIYSSLTKMSSEQRMQIFNWCSGTNGAVVRAEVLNVMGCVKELEGDNGARYEYFKQSAEMGNLQGVRNLATYFDRVGRFDEAVVWYTKAIEMGDVSSMQSLSGVYSRNLISKANKEKVAFWRAKYAATKY